jgi:hypothetical protein
MTPPVWSIRVAGTARDRARVSVRTHQFTVGRPLSFDVEDGAISALEYALGAVGAEIVNGLRAEAARRRLTIDHAEALVHGELDNPLTHLEVVGETGNPAIAGIRVKLYVSSPEGRPVVEAAWQHARRLLPLTRTLAAYIDVDLILTS